MASGPSSKFMLFSQVQNEYLANPSIRWLSKRALIALRPDDAAEALGISKSSLEKLVKAGKIRPPIAIPLLRIKLFDWERLLQDWQALIEEAENGAVNSWDDA
jgi:hypothetical protein